jgi:hypothetical protein
MKKRKNYKIMFLGRKKKIVNRFFKNKAMSFLLTFCFFILSVNQCIAHPESSIDNQRDMKDTSCYGFMVSPVKHENVIIQDQINCKMRHMINDLLREQISVYWTAEDVNASIIKINCSEEETVFFERGTFIIPFTGNISVDTKIIVVIYDYNYSSEIEEDNELKLSVYILREPLSNVHVYPLSEVKLAQHKNKISVGETCFLEISSESGFLSFEVLFDSIIEKKLKISEFNVLTQASSVPEYATFYHYESIGLYFYMLFRDLICGQAKAVRKFVEEGGGYIGSGYGAIAAGSGYKFGPFTIHFPRIAYNPKLPSILLYGLGDYIGLFYVSGWEGAKVKIFNDTHPVSYRLGEVPWECYRGGNGFIRIGKNTEVIAKFCNTDTELDNIACWVSSKFGNGKTVAFNTHPEMMGFGFYPDNMTHIGRTAISNALFYTTAKKMTILELTHRRFLTFIEEIFNKTGDIQIDTNTVYIFNETKYTINGTIDDITNLSYYVKHLMDLIKEIANEKNVELRSKSTYLGYNSLWITKKYYFSLFLKYLENTIEKLNTMEKIYPLLESDPNFVQQIETLKDDISSRIDEIQSKCSQGYEMCENYEEALFNYQKRQFLGKFKQFFLMNKGHRFYYHIFSVFSYIPQIYFNSLKLLRNIWYNYEVNIIDSL